jgi:primosomal protein N' (replication factor Y)
MLVKVALFESRLDFLAYKVPDFLRDKIKPGSLVEVPLRSKFKLGVVVGMDSPQNREFGEQSKLKDVHKVMLTDFVPENLFQLLAWARKYYFATWGQILAQTLPITTRRQLLKKLSERTSQVINKLNIQSGCLDSIRTSINKQEYRTYLVFDKYYMVSFSDYGTLISTALNLGRSVIFLIPEIALIPEYERGFRSLGLEHYFVWHSDLKRSEILAQWFRIKNEATSFVLGTRSAIFAPVNNLGLIIVVKEHERYYKEEKGFHYQARDLAVKYGELSKAVVLLVSETPSFESYYNATIGKYTLLKLNNRPQTEKVGANIKIINLQRSKEELLSLALKRAILNAYQDNKNIILLHNRLGYAHFILCQDCGFVNLCSDCGVPLVLDQDKGCFICNLCQKTSKAFTECPQCRGSSFLFRGLGVQKIVKELNKILPSAQIITRTGRFSKFRSDNPKPPWILITTKCDKGEFLQTAFSLLGIVLADHLLFLPDFRSAERTFQQLSEVIHEATNNKVAIILQTYRPNNPAIYYAYKNNYEKFFNYEIMARRKLYYPPFMKLIEINIFDKDPAKILRSLEVIIKRLSNIDSIRILGPIILPKSRRRGLKTGQILIKSSRPLSKLICREELLGGIKPEVKIDINVDP